MSLPLLGQRWRASLAHNVRQRPPALVHPPHAPRSTPRPAGLGRAPTLPCWLPPDTNHRIGKDRPGPDRDERALSFSMTPDRGILPEKSIRFTSIAAVGPWIMLSRQEALNASGSTPACRMAISRNVGPIFVRLTVREAERLRPHRIRVADQGRLDRMRRAIGRQERTVMKVNSIEGSGTETPALGSTGGRMVRVVWSETMVRPVAEPEKTTRSG